MPEREDIITWGDGQVMEVTVLERPVVSPLGVRPKDLTWLGAGVFFEDNSAWYEHMHLRLKRLAAQALRHHDASRVVGTLALGWDTAVLETAADLGLAFEVRLPCRGVQTRWTLPHKQRFSRLVGKAERVDILHAGGYQSWKVLRALQACAEDADLVIALWNGRDTVLRKVLHASRQHGVEVVNLWKSWQAYGGLAKGGR